MTSLLLFSSVLKVGVKKIIIFINVNNDEELVEQFKTIVRTLLTDNGFHGNSPIIRGSAYDPLHGVMNKFQINYN